VLQYSIQADHLHLVVEADGPTEFERGVRGLAIRVAKSVNHALGRAGRVWGDRVCSGFPVKDTRLLAPFVGGLRANRASRCVTIEYSRSGRIG